ncbi:DUF983 domain-containing protein [Rhodopila sp.]|jgi:uncharacterized protein (DUF983 family)|uniref:DUF983 domain-containing protein n=1 Tax=Rhodopila sp. TaxID=2480087 RepID=UPI002CAAB050|nr:DUF983 domain-containing protein [Rhodopila sp.]HVZ08462.1 DUF983 domain-containing protein [Rhodopila sp.]
MAPTRWTAETAAKPANPWPQPTMSSAILWGLKGRCPACGKGKIFNKFLKIVPACSACGAPLGLARADDAPPYLTILVVGHIVVPLLFEVDRMGEPPVWLMAAIFLPLTLALCLALLQPIKGATVGVMTNLDMLKSTPPG